MRPSSQRSRPLAPDVALIAGVFQVVAAPVALVLPSVETCLSLMMYPPVRLGCRFDSILDVYGLSLNGPMLGLAALLTAGLMLVAVGRGHKPRVQLVWLWIAVALDMVGLVLAWMVAFYFVPTTACAIGAAVMFGRGQAPAHSHPHRAFRVRRS